MDEDRATRAHATTAPVGASTAVDPLHGGADPIALAADSVVCSPVEGGADSTSPSGIGGDVPTAVVAFE